MNKETVSIKNQQNIECVLSMLEKINQFIENMINKKDNINIDHSLIILDLLFAQLQASTVMLKNN